MRVGEPTSRRHKEADAGYTMQDTGCRIQDKELFQRSLVECIHRQPA